MPKIAVFAYLTFTCYLFDVLHEPPHLHIRTTKKGHDSVAKIWLETITFANTKGLTRQEQALVKKLVTKHQVALLKQWDKLRNGEPVRPLTLTLK